MDIVALIIGFILGVIVVGIAVEIGIKKVTSATPSSKHTNKWSISEISNPKIMAEYLSDVDLPKNSKVIVNKCADRNMLAGLDAKEHSGIKGNFIVGDDRALILSGPLKKDEVGFWTVEEEIVKKLNQDFDEMWTEAETMKFEEDKK
jgi:hypothetical protein